jgi:linoleate 10R-lipoxygenase
LIQAIISRWAGRNNSDGFLKPLQVATENYSADQIAATLVSDMISTAAIYSKAVAHIVNFYLDDSRKEARANIVQLSTLRTPESVAKVQAYIREALSKYMF